MTGYMHLWNVCVTDWNTKTHYYWSDILPNTHYLLAAVVYVPVGMILKSTTYSCSKQLIFARNLSRLINGLINTLVDISKAIFLGYIFLLNTVSKSAMLWRITGRVPAQLYRVMSGLLQHGRVRLTWNAHSLI